MVLWHDGRTHAPCALQAGTLLLYRYLHAPPDRVIGAGRLAGLHALANGEGGYPAGYMDRGAGVAGGLFSGTLKICSPKNHHINLPLTKNPRSEERGSHTLMILWLGPRPRRNTNPSLTTRSLLQTPSNHADHPTMSR